VKVLVQARHMEVTEALRQHVEEKVSKLPHILDTLLSVEVILDKEADNSVVEVVAAASRKNTFVATHRDPDMYTSIDGCLHKIVEQLRRHKDKVRDRQKPPHGEIMGETPE
jgi:putative sigma-54 modulation protein